MSEQGGSFDADEDAGAAMQWWTGMRHAGMGQSIRQTCMQYGMAAKGGDVDVQVNHIAHPERNGHKKLSNTITSNDSGDVKRGTNRRPLHISAGGTEPNKVGTVSGRPGRPMTNLDKLQMKKKVGDEQQGRMH